MSTERLTEWVGEGEERYAIPSPHIRSNGHRKCCNRLAEYEDLGVSPEEVRQIDREYTKLAIELAKYKKAEKENRLEVFPCKPGDTLHMVSGGEYHTAEVYRVCFEQEQRHGKSLIIKKWIHMYLYGSMVQIGFDDVGKRWFLTKEEARKA